MPPLKAPLDIIKSKVWGFIEVYPQKNLNFGAGVKTLKMFGDTSGMGKPQILWFFWGKSPKIPKFWGEEGGRNIEDFPTTTLRDSKVSYVQPSAS